MKTVILHGALKNKFGEKFRFAAHSPAEAVRALLYQLKGFAEEIRQGEYKVIRTNEELDEQTLHVGFGKDKELHIIPVPCGSKNGGGIGKIVVGVALIAAALIMAPMSGGLSAVALAGLTYANMIGIGVMLTFAGVAAMLSNNLNAQGYEQRSEVDQRASFLFNGAINTDTQGVAIALVYGRFRVGSVVVSSGISVERIA